MAITCVASLWVFVWTHYEHGFSKMNQNTIANPSFFEIRAFQGAGSEKCMADPDSPFQGAG